MKTLSSRTRLGLLCSLLMHIAIRLFWAPLFLVHHRARGPRKLWVSLQEAWWRECWKRGALKSAKPGGALRETAACGTDVATKLFLLPAPLDLAIIEVSSPGCPTIYLTVTDESIVPAGQDVSVNQENTAPVECAEQALARAWANQALAGTAYATVKKVRQLCAH